ncbi:winged helix-turn-helix transcriptional regulator [Cryptosporangium arvum]|uniref:winged helix-turn-helix transcriptional regulator n=1 Tax=Cryptosporangium arvum TaxID=80871 RepID=UPI0004B6E693|nr:helix-turn-helix domain-containing protein [Cryptosporangium arvum]
MLSETPDEDACAQVLGVISRIGNKWTMLVLGRLRTGPRHFGELRRSVTGISHRMLTLTLRDLEADGFVTRRADPPHVKYALTERGVRMLDSVLALAAIAIDKK